MMQLFTIDAKMVSRENIKSM